MVSAQGAAAAAGLHQGITGGTAAIMQVQAISLHSCLVATLKPSRRASRSCLARNDSNVGTRRCVSSASKLCGAG